jgi:hypothetical protein
MGKLQVKLKLSKHHIINIIVGIVGVESNWVHSALRPPIGILCQPRVIIVMEKLVQ